ncbi:hypothetical protein HDU76_004332 [Blyttiomyces sp. JEL0837]|nr:hypothetical protein HDU76_004332 [Blyttiomyces sp. JEL0837]
MVVTIAPSSLHSSDERGTVKHTQKSCTLTFTPSLSTPPGKGELLITERKEEIDKDDEGEFGGLEWGSRINGIKTKKILAQLDSEGFKVLFINTTTSTAYTIDYPSIVIHAISRGNSNEPPCIYCQLDSNAVVDERGVNGGNGDEVTEKGGDGDEEEEEEEDDGDVAYEMRIIPDDGGALDDIFLALSECAALHPDKDMEGMDADDDGGDWIFSEETAQELDEARQAALDHLESVFEGGLRREDALTAVNSGAGTVNGQQQQSQLNGQFEDADEEDREAEQDGGVVGEDQER